MWLGGCEGDFFVPIISAEINLKISGRLAYEAIFPDTHP